MFAVSSFCLIRRLYALARVGAIAAALPLSFFIYETASADPGDRLSLDDGIGRVTDTATESSGTTIGDVTSNGSSKTTSGEAGSIPALDAVQSIPQHLAAGQATHRLVDVPSMAEPAIETAVQTAAPVVQIATPGLEPTAPAATAMVAPLVHQAAPVLEPVYETTAPLVSPIVEAVEAVVTPVREVTGPKPEPVVNTVPPVISLVASSDLGTQELVDRIPCGACDSTSSGALEKLTIPTATFLFGVVGSGHFSRLDLNPSGSARAENPIAFTPGRPQDRAAPETSPSAGNTVGRVLVSLLDGASTRVQSESGAGKQVAALALIGLLGISLWQSCRRFTEAWQCDRLSYAFLQPPR